MANKCVLKLLKTQIFTWLVIKCNSRKIKNFMKRNRKEYDIISYENIKCWNKFNKF